MTKINIKHKAFIDEYLINGMNGTQAYMSVYKSVKNSKTAEASASRLLSNDKVAAYLAEQQAKSAKKSEVTRDEIIADLKQIKDDWKGADKIPPYALKSIEILNKMLGFNEADKSEIVHKGLIVNYVKPKDESGD